MDSAGSRLLMSYRKQLARGTAFLVSVVLACGCQKQAVILFGISGDEVLHCFRLENRTDSDLSALIWVTPQQGSFSVDESFSERYTIPSRSDRTVWFLGSEAVAGEFAILQGTDGARYFIKILLAPPASGSLSKCKARAPVFSIADEDLATSDRVMDSLIREGLYAVADGPKPSPTGAIWVLHNSTPLWVEVNLFSALFKAPRGSSVDLPESHFLAPGAQLRVNPSTAYSNGGVMVLIGHSGSGALHQAMRRERVPPFNDRVYEALESIAFAEDPEVLDEGIPVAVYLFPKPEKDSLYSVSLTESRFQVLKHPEYPRPPDSHPP
jgi:hypothetical protein